MATGEPILVAEGYLFELERRCYGKMGSMVPEVLIDNPQKVKELHQDFVHVGTDVVEAYTVRVRCCVYMSVHIQGVRLITEQLRAHIL